MTSSATTVKPVVVVNDASGNKICGMSTVSCCTQIGRDQTPYLSWLQPSNNLPQTLFQSSNVNCSFTIPSGFNTHLCDNAFLEMNLYCTSPTGYTGNYGLTGGTSGGISLVNVFSMFQYFSESVSGLEYANKYAVGEHHRFVNSLKADQQTALDNACGIDPVTYADNLTLPSQSYSPGATVRVRLPLDLWVANAQFPLCFTDLPVTFILRTSGGPQIIRAGSNTPTDMSYVNVDATSIKLYLAGRKLGPTTLEAYKNELKTKGPIKINYSENRFFTTSVGTLVAAQTLTPNLITQGVFYGGYYQISPTQATGSQITYGSIPITAATLAQSGQDIISSLNSFQNWTDLQIDQQAYYLPNIQPQLHQTMNLLSVSENFMENLKTGCSDGQFVSGGSNLIWNIVVGGSGSNMSLNAWLYCKSTMLVDFAAGLILSSVRGTAL